MPSNIRADTPYTKNTYTDASGSQVTIQNSFPKGGLRYTDPHGKAYVYAVFWTHIINETAQPFNLNIGFPVDSIELTSSPGSYFRILLPPDTMTTGKTSMFNYGLPRMELFLDTALLTPSTLKRTIAPHDSSAFYVVTLANQWVNGTLRAGLHMEKGKYYYVINGMKMYCGEVDKGFVLQP
ncbi:hypothetical protein [Chitinophaga skermanii]|nr:hypothetical protein [Chitinophaga skermanii]